VKNDRDTVAALIERLRNEPDEVVWIWAAQNKHDVSGYYWLMSQLKDFQGRIFILYLNNLPFINEKGHIFYPVTCPKFRRGNSSKPETGPPHHPQRI